jgi:threonine dehydrogenase-like Zn-dependent dehydrogenase
MRGAILYAPGDVRCEERADPMIMEPADAIVRAVATCVCGSDLWRYRGIDQVTQATAIGHEYCGIVEQVGDAVTSIQPGQFVVGGFYASDNTCPHCRNGMHFFCNQRTGFAGCQSELIRIPLADGTLLATPEQPAKDLIPSLLALSDVMATGWHAAVSAGVKPGMTVAVVGDGAVGLCGVLAASQLGAARVIAMSRHQPRQQLAKEFGATDIVSERGEEGIARVKELTDGVGGCCLGVCGHRRIGGAGGAIRPTWGHGRLGRRTTWRRTSHAGPVLAECGDLRRRRPGAELPTRPDGSSLESEDRARQGVRHGAAAGAGGRSVRRHGPAPRHQGPAATLRSRPPFSPALGEDRRARDRKDLADRSGGQRF